MVSRSELLFKLRNNPVAIAAGAGTIGLLSGALFVFIASPHAAAPEPTASAAVHAVPKDTTGQASDKQTSEKQHASSADQAVASESSQEHASTDTPSNPDDANPPGAGEQDAASLNCDRQAWPYITPECKAEQDRARRKVRVITTDKLSPPVVSAIEAGTAARAPEQVATKPDVKADDGNQAKAGSAPVASRETSPVPKPAAAPTVEAKTPIEPVEPVTANAGRDSQPVQASGAEKTAEKAEKAAEKTAEKTAEDRAPAAAPTTSKQRRAMAKEERRKARERRREAREEREARAREAAMARADERDARDDRDDEGDDVAESRAERYAPRRGRHAERWAEREYYVPSEDRPHQRRRVIIIRRMPYQGGNPYMPSVSQYSRTISEY